jgi:hypothetical protein
LTTNLKAPEITNNNKYDYIYPTAVLEALLVGLIPPRDMVTVSSSSIIIIVTTTTTTTITVAAAASVACAQVVPSFKLH